MQVIRLSKRLQTVLELVPPGLVMADIGTDHGYLPIAAVQQGVTNQVIAGDVRSGPWQSAVQNIESAGLSAKIDVRLGDGLEVLQPGEAEVITICGMGGSLMRDLVANGSEKRLTGKVRRLVLQPNIGEHGLRTWLRTNGWQIICEIWLEEDGYVYPVIAAEPALELVPDAVPPFPDGTDWKAQFSLTVQPLLAADPWKWIDLFGWHNLLQPSEAWREKWQREAAQCEQMLRSLEKAESEESLKRKQDVRDQLDVIREVLK